MGRGIKTFAILSLMLFLSGCLSDEATLYEEEQVSTECELGQEGEESSYIDIPIGEKEKKKLQTEITKLALEYIQYTGESKIEDKKELTHFLASKGYAVRVGYVKGRLENWQLIDTFCLAAQAGKAGTASIYTAYEEGSFQRIDFVAKDKKLQVTGMLVNWENNQTPIVSEMKRYEAYSWSYTPKGWFFYKKYYPRGYDGPLGGEAICVKPSPEYFRDYEAKYIEPISYDNNSLFMTDWQEGAWGSMDFNDLYEVFYEAKNKQAIKDITYGIEEQNFEALIQQYLKITPQELKKVASYEEENQKYSWWPRTVYEAVSPALYWPEITEIKENEEDTFTLVIDVIAPEYGTDCAFTHELTIRQLKDGSFQYVANKVLPSQDNIFPQYIPRDWGQKTGEEKVAEQEQPRSFRREKPSIGASITSEEMKELKETFLKHLSSSKDFYSEKHLPSTQIVSREVMKQLVEYLAKQGVPVIGYQVNMANSEQVESFYSKLKQGEETEVPIYEVDYLGNISCHFFIKRGATLQKFYMGASFSQDKGFEVISTNLSEVDELRLTEKGYLLYHMTDADYVAHSALYYSFRVRPLSEECRNYQEKYLKHISLVNYNLLIEDWNQETIGRLDFNEMFEDLYRMDTGEIYKEEGHPIPEKVFEGLMEKYFNVTQKELRQYANYQAEKQSYTWEAGTGKLFSPLPEVVSYQQNQDGTLTLKVDALWIDYNTDCAFTSTLTVLPLEDGRFKYLSNKVEVKEKEVPVIYREE